MLNRRNFVEGLLALPSLLLFWKPKTEPEFKALSCGPMQLSEDEKEKLRKQAAYDISVAKAAGMDEAYLMEDLFCVVPMKDERLKKYMTYNFFHPSTSLEDAFEAAERWRERQQLSLSRGDPGWWASITSGIGCPAYSTKDVYDCPEKAICELILRYPFWIDVNGLVADTFIAR